jgi:hypothetical protein
MGKDYPIEWVHFPEVTNITRKIIRALLSAVLFLLKISYFYINLWHKVYILQCQL